ncbi:unnamed protein product [Oikopleura dioica]|uniref:Uncharacterized protein n=1 Tax=Oikopleura dioica TaxID=34765 RepID=E4YAZ2_OIKDI|nr:unnamed protein product [Oikopleura dioica]
MIHIWKQLESKANTGDSSFTKICLQQLPTMFLVLKKRIKRQNHTEPMSFSLFPIKRMLKLRSEVRLTEIGR